MILCNDHHPDAGWVLRFRPKGKVVLLVFGEPPISEENLEELASACYDVSQLAASYPGHDE